MTSLIPPRAFHTLFPTMDMGTKMRAALLELEVIEIIFGPVIKAAAVHRFSDS